MAKQRVQELGDLTKELIKKTKETFANYSSNPAIASACSRNAPGNIASASSPWNQTQDLDAMASSAAAVLSSGSSSLQRAPELC